ncbi:MAG: porin, partial [Allorhizobium sp.]
EPEPMEYVRVCDAFGTGYFYIPGTETCLKIGGEVRATVSWSDDDARNDEFEWNSAVRARVTFEAKNDSEIGTIGSYIRLQGDTVRSGAAATATLDQAYITAAGFKVGYALSWWDDVGIAGENDFFAANTKFNLASYTYTADAFEVGVGVDDLGGYYADNVGAEAKFYAAFGSVALNVWGAYDFAVDEGSVAGKIGAGIGPGTFELYGAYASGFSVYAQDSEWTVGAAYALKATEKLTLTPSVNYWGDVNWVSGNERWGAGILAEYQIATGLKASATVDYYDLDSAPGDAWSGFFRLTRSF